MPNCLKTITLEQRAIPSFSYDSENNWVYVTYPGNKRYAYTNVSPFHWRELMNKFAKIPANARVSQVIKYINARVKAGTSKSIKLDKYGRPTEGISKRAMIEKLMTCDPIREVVSEITLADWGKELVEKSSIGGNALKEVTALSKIFKGTVKKMTNDPHWSYALELPGGTGIRLEVSQVIDKLAKRGWVLSKEYRTQIHNVITNEKLGLLAMIDDPAVSSVLRFVTLYVGDRKAVKSSLTLNEKIVLHATRSLKSSYGGIKQFRFHEANRNTDITRSEWDNAKQSLVKKKFMNRRGAITDKGRDALELAIGKWTQEWPTEEVVR